MEIFNHKKLKYRNATLHGELFENSSIDLPLTLFWKISILLDDFQIGNFTIHNPEIELGSFTLPHTSKGQDIDRRVKVLKSWKQIPNSTFDFSKSFIDNIGSIYYNIKIKELGNDWNTNAIDTEATEFFDNIIDIHRIEFGEFTQNRINCKLTIKIHFDGFNMNEPPFGKEFYCDIFDIEVELEIGKVNLLNSTPPVKNILEALTISEKALQVNDYEIQSENKQIFVSLTEHKERMHYFFKPKF